MTTWGIALGGGGAKGLAHIGVLEVLADVGLEFDVVIGTSAGALVGAVYASNELPGLIREVRKIRLTDIPRLLSPSWSFSGLFSGTNVLQMLEKLFAEELIEDLPRRFGAVACDLTTGESVLFSKGSTNRAVRASIAIPGVFTPVQHSGKVFVDGGVLEPVPVTRGQALGAEAMIAVDLFGDESQLRCRGARAPRSRALGYLHSLQRKLLSKKGDSADQPQSSLIDVLMDTFVVSQRYLTAQSLRASPPRIVLRPKVANIGILDFHRADTVIELGRAAALEELSRIKREMRKG